MDNENSAAFQTQQSVILRKRTRHAVRTAGRHESSGRRTVLKIGHVVEEADETCYGLEVIRAAGIASGVTLDRLLGEAGQLTAIVSQSQLTAKANASAYGRRQNRRQQPPILDKSVNA
jgi:hypothetical protein